MSIYQHFRPEEKEFIDQAQNLKEQVRNSYAPKLTDFLDPREQQILMSITGNDAEVKIEFFGGGEHTERKRAMLFPDYFIPGEEDYQVVLFEVIYPKKFVAMEHRQILGTLMSLGLKREKFGDVLISGDSVQIVAAKEIENYLLANLNKVGKSAVALKEKPLEKIIQAEEKWEETVTTVSSMRLDVVLSSLLNLSREKTKALIISGKVKVNFKEEENTSEECREGDILSVRGFGRCKILSIDGKTKKDKWRITAGRQK
ncbi:RNA-binding protein [Bacillus sp. M6-12]|uniref:YlmH family RNA-binding protein n=1 Tax=Bacillus sp. M6-12 TaxID=2054166 RepID=UPI000C776660|nr:RNA-binding protein [Bacillus sp. M6-12]PLS16609.1 RNA-binding protein [Bacillus sp. M6-12]